MPTQWLTCSKLPLAPTPVKLKLSSSAQPLALKALASESQDLLTPLMMLDGLINVSSHFEVALVAPNFVPHQRLYGSFTRRQSQTMSASL